MNLFFITARILKQPYKLNNLNLIKVQINFPQSKNHLANVTALANGKLASNILEFYTHGDYVVIEGEILIIKKQVRKTDVVINIIDIHPADLIIS